MVVNTLTSVIYNFNLSLKNFRTNHETVHHRRLQFKLQNENTCRPEKNKENLITQTKSVSKIQMYVATHLVKRLVTFHTSHFVHYLTHKYT